uniref:Interleukin-15 receptor subunit alpha n=1 Tax=Castor canadensis TaxID=51338 RepID=A0A8B7V2Y7_CASCN
QARGAEVRCPRGAAECTRASLPSDSCAQCLCLGDTGPIGLSRGKGRRGRAGACVGTTCPTPTSVEHADIRVKSYNVNSRERYVCNSGFKRKAGTSSLIQCVLNETTNIAHWTTPNLKCIRDPSLTHQRPVPPSTVVTTRVTPTSESPFPSGKEPTALFPKSDTTVATETAIIPGTQLTPSQPASAGTTGIGSHESSQTPSQTTARVLESTPFTSHEITGVHPYSSKQAIVTISTSVSTFCTVLVMLLLLWCFRSRQTSQPPAVEVERMEVMPMTPGTSSREEEDTGIYPHSP